MKEKEIELCTFPDDDNDFCKLFKVQKNWLINLLEKLDSFNERKGVDIDEFLENYIWDETWFVYMQAKKEDKIIEEKVEH